MAQTSIPNLEIKLDRLSKILGSIKTLTSHDVLVGYPEDKAEPRTVPQTKDEKKKKVTPTQDTMTNAAIAFLQERGSSLHNLPPRPFMVPGVNSVKGRAEVLLRRAALLGLEGKRAASVDVLHALGMIGVSGIQRALTRGEGWHPLAPSTIFERQRRGVFRTHPLIDTGQLRAHVTYVIRRKSGHSTLTASTDLPE